MNKKVLLLLTVGAGVVAATSLLKTERLNKEDREKVDEYKKFLEEKGYKVSKNGYLPTNLELLSVSALPMYYKAAKTIAKFVF
ncbi:hypothetical protein [Gemella morbillorum]|uniref:hypothetical protein n=1 Tax=Gemella morbillorum TaxID=29391 RepID=UPI00248F108A|nr:hypothetical protein [Gemella morbillorum]